MTFHPAPWSRSLAGLTVLSTGICTGVAFLLATREGPAGRLGAWLMVWIVGLALLFTVRGYWISGDALRVRRLLWSTRLPLSGLVSAVADPQAMRDSFRTFVNGGFFAFTGRFHNERLGAFRAYVTDPARAVVLRYEDRAIVVSPADPERFLRDLEAARTG